MHHHRPCTGRNAARATSTVLKWILIAVLIVFLGLQTLPSPTNLVNREETAPRQHQKTLYLNAGPTSSPLTKVMRVLLHHLPARRSESVVLALGQNGMQQGEDYHDPLNDLFRRNYEVPAESRLDDIDSPDARDLHDGNPSRAEKEGREVIRDLIGHDNTGHLCSTMECFCKSTGRCKRESIRNNVAYKGPDRNRKNQRTVTSIFVDGEVDQYASHHEDHEIHEIPHHKPCRCGPPDQKCRCGDKEGHSAERLQVARETERIGIDAISHFRPSDPSSKMKYYQSNEREATGGHVENKSFEQDSDSPLGRPIIDGREVPSCFSSLCIHKFHHGQGQKSGSFSKTSSAGISNSSQVHRQLVYKRDTSDAGSATCRCNEYNKNCHCAESAQLEHLLVDKKGARSTLPDVEGKETPRHDIATVPVDKYWPGHTNKANCTCGACTYYRNWWKQPGWKPPCYECEKRPRDLANSHDLLEGEENGSPTSLATTCNTLPDEGGSFTDFSVHLAEVKNRRDNTFLDSITEVKCGNKVGAEKDQCEQNYRTGFWILCSVLAVAGSCGLLLGLLILHLHFRRKKSSPLLISSRPVHKSVASPPVCSVTEIQKPNVVRTVGMRRIEEDEIDETLSVRRYTTLDGAMDGWTRWINKQKHGAKISQKGHSPQTPSTAAPRIPTLKLPQTTLAATMRKINGLGSERGSASQGHHTWKGKGKDLTRVKWCSTV